MRLTLPPPVGPIYATTPELEYEAAVEPAAAEPAPPGPVVPELDLTLDNQTDRARFQLGTLSSELRYAILHHGLCRPKGPFATISENGNRRIFAE